MFMDAPSTESSVTFIQCMKYLSSSTSRVMVPGVSVIEFARASFPTSLLRTVLHSTIPGFMGLLGCRTL